MTGETSRPAGRGPHLGVSGPAAAKERHASALELFFDLVFVVAVAELAETFQEHPTPVGALRYGALFVAVWWSWVGYTFFADRLGDDNDVTHRILLIVAMLAVISLAVAIPGAFHGSTGGIRFAASYLAVRLMLILLYARVHHFDPGSRPLTGRYLTGFCLGAALWGASIAVPAPGRYWLWALGLLIELGTPLVSASAIARVPFHVSHIPERFGLFVIIVLGEAVTLDALGIAADRMDPLVPIVAAVGFGIAAALWWLYFDRVDTSPMRRWIVTGQIYVYGHLPVFAGITALGVGVLLGTDSVTEPHLATAARWSICGGLGAVVLAIGAIHLANTPPRGDLRAWSRIGAGTVYVLLGLTGQALPVLAVELLLLLGVAAQVFWESKLPTTPDAHTQSAAATLLGPE